MLLLLYAQYDFKLTTAVGKIINDARLQLHVMK